MNKPPFNPNLPYQEVDSGGKPPFDPSQPFEETESKQPEMTLEGFGKNIRDRIIENVQAVGAVGNVASNYFPLNIPKQMYQAAAGQPYEPPPIERDAQIIGETAKALPGALVHSVTRYKNPIRAIYDDPVSAAIDATAIGTAVKPLFQATKAAGVAARTAAQESGKAIAKPLFESTTGRRFMSAALGPSEEAIAERIARPVAIGYAKQSVDIADDLAKSVGTIKGQIKTGSEAAAKTLNPNLFNSPGVRTKSSVIGKITKLQNELKTGDVVIGEAEQLAFNKLERLKSRVRQMTDGKKGMFNDRISESNIEGLVKSIDPDIDYNKAINSVANEKLMRFRSILDRSLKQSNPKYRESMLPVSERMKTVQGVQKKFNLRAGDKGELVPDNVTASNLEKATSEKMSVSQDLLESVKKFTGKDYLQEIRDWKTAEQFLPGSRRPNGSRMVNWGSVSGGGTLGTIGATAGGLIGGVPGAIIGGGLGGALGGIGGAMVGGYMDKQGGAIAGRLIDIYLKSKAASKVGKAAVESVNPVAAEYGPILLDAVEKTGITLEEASSQLMQSDPGFKKILLEIIQPDEPRKQIFKNNQPRSIFKKAS